jgi:hypothetical protein
MFLNKSAARLLILILFVGFGPRTTGAENSFGVPQKLSASYNISSFDTQDRVHEDVPYEEWGSSSREEIRDAPPVASKPAHSPMPSASTPAPTSTSFIQTPHDSTPAPTSTSFTPTPHDSTPTLANTSLPPPLATAAPKASPKPTFFSSLKERSHFVIELGGFRATQGKSQQVDLNDDQIPDNFTVTQSQDSNVVGGMGYYVDGQETKWMRLSYGINAFYLAPTKVIGTVPFEPPPEPPLSIYYTTTSMPIYLATKALINNSYSNKYNMVIDLGIGPNFLTTSDVKPTSPNPLLTTTHGGATAVTLSAMAGIGLRVNHVFGQNSLECGYRFFYLGQGKFNNVDSDVTSTLQTGDVYANAVLCSMVF